jgi:hypothetical protein
VFDGIIFPTIYFPIFHIQPRSVLAEFGNYSTVTDLAKFLGLSMS